MFKCALLALLLLGGTTSAEAVSLHIRPVEQKPLVRELDDEVNELARAAKADPKDRGLRMKLIHALRRSGRLEAALDEARAWRQVDAYNLVVVRTIGDLLAELGRRDEARRVYSAVVELVPTDAQAHRALATVLKQSGDVEGAYQRLVTADQLAPGDRRIEFELADAAQRTGHTDEAKKWFEQIGAGEDALSYPARQRLQQVLGGELRAATKVKDVAKSKALRTEIEALNVAGGLTNDLKIYLTWDTDHSDVDLWVTTPDGEKVFYANKRATGGESLYDDVTTGYGPESFTAHEAQAGNYLVQVNYYSTGRSNFDEARGEVTIVLHEGAPEEQRVVLPYRLFEAKQTVSVAKVLVGGGVQ